MVAELTTFVGLDVSERRIEAHVRPQALRRGFATGPEGLAALLAWLTELAAPLIVLEATGGLEKPLARCLAEAGLAVAVVNPRHVRQFAKGLGLLAKTDRLDAAVIARYGELARPVPRPTRQRAGRPPAGFGPASPASRTASQRRGQPAAPSPGPGGAALP